MRRYVKVNEDGTAASQRLYFAHQVSAETGTALAPDDAPPQGWESYIEPERPEGLTKYDILVFGELEKTDGGWTQTVTLSQADADQQQEIDGRKTLAARKQRNDLLSRSDYTQLLDADLTDEQKAQWAEYRQKLRDITEDAGFPVYHRWPQPPV